MKLKLIQSARGMTTWRIYGKRSHICIERGHCDHQSLRVDADGWLVWRDGEVCVAEREEAGSPVGSVPVECLA